MSLALYSTVEEYYIDQRGKSLLKKKMEEALMSALYTVSSTPLRVPTGTFRASP